MKRKLYLRTFMMLLMGVAFTATSIFAQGRKVSGKVTDSGDNSGLPGVSVVVKGTSKGVTTDLEGKYTIDVAGTSDVLVFSYVGFLNQDVAVGNQSMINVGMVLNENSLEELIVTGYTSEKKKRYHWFGIYSKHKNYFTAT